MTVLLPITYTCLLTFILNVPFGYFRQGTRKFSFLWFLFIHLPVPLVIVSRKYFGVELSWELAPFLFGSFFFGQWLGKKLRIWTQPNAQTVDAKRV